jgi:hypothetical protein
MAVIPAIRSIILLLVARPEPTILTALVDSFRIPSWKEAGNLMKNVAGDFKLDDRTGRVWKALFTGEPQLDLIAKTDAMTSSVLKKSLNIKVGQKGWHVPLGGLMSLNFHGLAAPDELFKNIGYQSKLYSILGREARKQGITDAKDIKMFVTDKQANLGTPENIGLHYEALSDARHITFSEPLGKGFSKGIEDAFTNNNLGLFMRIVNMPFFRIMVNLTKYTGKHSPLGFVSKEFAGKIRNGGVDRAEAISQLVTGSAIFATGLYLYEQGNLTGMTPRSKRESNRNAGVMDYSIVTHDEEGMPKKFWSIKRDDPFSMMWGLMANFGQFYDMWSDVDNELIHPDDRPKWDEIATTFITGMADSMLSKTWMRSANDLVKMFTEPERMNFKQWSFGQLEKLVPHSKNIDWANEQIRHAHDVYRELNEYMDVIRKKYDPTKLRVKLHSVYGTPIKRFRRKFGFRDYSEYTDDPVAQEMHRIGLEVKPLPKEISLMSRTTPYEMEPEEYYRFQQKLAQYDIQGTLQQIIESPEYQNSNSDYWKKTTLAPVINGFRRAVTAEMKSELEKQMSNKAEELMRYTDAHEG